MTSSVLLRRQRDDQTIEVPAPMWAEMLLFLSTCGWRPSIPGNWLLADGQVVSEEDAKSLAAAGQIVLDRTLKTPFDAYEAIQFDLGKFAQIVTFASEGSFTIHHVPSIP